MLKQIMLFAFNYNRQDIIEKIWADDEHMKVHLRGKFDGYGAFYKNNQVLFLHFVSELSDDKVKDIEEYIKNNPS